MINEKAVVGQAVPRIDAIAKATGEARFPGDLSLPGMLHMKILFAERPHARIVRMDTSQAEAYPGVVAVFTANDVPINEYGLQWPDQPVLCGPSSEKPGADVVRFVGDQIALIGPWGARGVGEPPFLPLAPALLAAIRDATGVWLDEIPVTPERMLQAIHRTRDQ